MLEAALKQYYFLEEPFLCCIRVNPYTLCGYVRLYQDHPFQRRTEQDKEVRRLSPRITFAADDLDGEGWWLGIYRVLLTPSHATPIEMEHMRCDLRQLTLDLRPRRHAYAEYAAWSDEARHALHERLRSSHVLQSQR